MPIFDLGYRRYEGRAAARAARFWPIARTSFSTVRRWPFWLLLGLGGIPLFFHLVAVYTMGVAGDQSGFFRRHTLLGFNDGLYFRLLDAETFWVVLLLTVSGAGQIAEDLRSGALQIYFSKPVNQLDYVIGKLLAVLLSALCLTLLPALVLFLGMAAFAPDWSWLAGNPLLPLRLLAYSLLIATVLGSAVLALSSLGRRGRMVGLTFAGGWFFLWILGRALPGILDDPRWCAVDVGQCLSAAGRTFFRQGPVPDAPVGIAWIVLGSIVFTSILVFTRKVDAAEVVR